MSCGSYGIIAVAAGAYLGKIFPTIPDDPTAALCTMIESLPQTCFSFFSQGVLTCPFCKAAGNCIIPTFSSSVTWIDKEWKNFKSILATATPFAGSIPSGWHAPDGKRSDFDVAVKNKDSGCILSLSQMMKPFTPRWKSLVRLLGAPLCWSLGFVLRGMFAPIWNDNTIGIIGLLNFKIARSRVSMNLWEVFRTITKGSSQAALCNRSSSPLDVLYQASPAQSWFRRRLRQNCTRP